jgi:acetyl esterase/lipase
MSARLPKARQRLRSFRPRFETLEDRTLLSGGLSFADPIDYTAGANPRSVTTGDFRGIGIQDLAVANFGSNNVSIFLGDGHGAFRLAETIQVGTRPDFVTTGHFHDPNILDLAVANSGSNDVSILWGQGDGSFGFPHSYVSILLGNGHGTFAPASSIGVGGAATFVVAAVFTGNGRSDLAITTVDSSSYQRGTLSILLSNGDGTFRSAQSLTTVGRGLTSVVASDFRGDGVVDLAVAGSLTDTVSVLLGIGDGTFTLDRNYPVEGRPQSIAVGNFTGNGARDLVTVSDYAAVSVMLGNCDGTFQTSQNFWGGANPVSVAVGDFNGAGREDVAIAQNFTNQVSILLNNTPQPPDGVTVFRDIVYYDGPYSNPQRQNLDVYVPPDRTDFPVVFLAYGGMYRNGDKSRQAYLAQSLAREGLGVVAINYRITDGSPQQVVFPGQEVDVARAFAWTYHHIADYGGNRDSIVLLGHSSGGGLVSLLATDRRYLAAYGLSPDLVQGVITVSGGNFDLRVLGIGFEDVFGDVEQRWEASPLKYVDGTQPPFLLVYGSNDVPGFPEDTTIFYQALVNAGSEAELHMIPGRNHQMTIGDAARPGDPVRELILRFIREHVCTVSLAPSQPSPQLVGEPITWTATAINCGETPVYQFSVGLSGGPYHVVRDFSPSDSFTWAPIQEGTYYIKVTVKADFGATATHSAVASYVVDSRVTGSTAVISPTPNPLVALYSVPSGPEGTVHVEFSAPEVNPSWRHTDERPSVPGESTNFFVAGMLPSTTYQMRHVFSDGSTSAPLLFTTGAIPPSVVFPPFTVIQPPGPGSDLDQDMLFQQYPGLANSNYTANPVVTDLQGQVTWYYDVSQSGFIPNLTDLGHSLVPGGTVLVMGANHEAPLPTPTSRNILREIDLAGDTVRETNVAAVNAQLTALGHNIIYSLTHDVQRLPNGQTAVIGLTERTVNINGTPTDYIGAMIILLDADFQVTWAWDAFDHLDVNRGPVLGEIVQPGDIGPTTAVPRLPAVDWLHLNAVSWSPVDGNLVLSIRHQDWVIKVDYRNGEGDGHVIWRLGQGGDFAVNSPDPNPWFSHQHNARYIDDSRLILFDNGDTRRASDPSADSRGQLWTLDEQTMTATLAFNVDLGNYSDALGAAQRLSNGNYSFTSGRQGQPPNRFGQSIEVRPDGTKAYVLQVDRTLYRSFRVRTLYGGISDQLAAGGGSGQSAGRSGSGSLASSASDPAGVNSGVVNGNGVSNGTPGVSPDDIGAAIAIASISPLNLPTLGAVPVILPKLVNEALALHGIDIPFLDATDVTGEVDSKRLTGVVRELHFAKPASDVIDWDVRTDWFVER